MPQLTFASLHPKTSPPIRSEIFLTEMKAIVPWKRLLKTIKPHYYNNKTGRKPMDLLLMIRIYCLQQWFNLSDPAMEEAIYDRLSFQKFLELDLMRDKVPDESTILQFRHLLEKHELTSKIFRTINRYLTEKGLLMREGTIVDATLVAAPSSTKNQEKKRDPEMSSTKKNSNYTFGMKTHVGVDAESGLIHTCISTTAKVSDRTEFSNLLHGKETAVFGDKGYVSDRDKHFARDAEIYWGILDKSKPKKKLSSKQKKRNQKLSSIRAKVEHGFLIVKHLWGHRKVRYRGLYKNSAHMEMLYGLANLYRVRKTLLSMS